MATPPDTSAARTATGGLTAFIWSVAAAVAAGGMLLALAAGPLERGTATADAEAPYPFTVAEPEDGKSAPGLPGFLPDCGLCRF